MNKEAIIKRIDDLLGLAVADGARGDPDTAARIAEMYQGTIQLCSAIYGPDCRQAATLELAYKPLGTRNGPTMQMAVQPVAVGTLNALRAEIQQGLIASVLRLGAGEALGDFLTLGKDALAIGTENAKNVAAVLIAALFEDTIRRMGESFAGIDGRPDLQEVLIALKRAKLLEGASYTIAVSYLKFRNDALHADWEKITRGAVESCIGFVEGLIRDHFG